MVGDLTVCERVFFQFLPLITALGPLPGVGTTTVPDCVPDVLPPGERVGLSAIVDENESDMDPTAYATTQLLRGVRDSVGAFGPLKSVAGSLCSILENCEVGFPPRAFNPQCS